jgi:ABC-type nickel/cobalt efflux system permease component RcnA
MSGHLVVHYLDVFRHDAAYSWVWYSWIGNISAGIVVFLVMSLFWPRARHVIEAFAKRHVQSIHDKLDEQHEEHLSLVAHHHKEALALARKHHAEHMVALGKPAPGQARNEKGRFT